MTHAEPGSVGEGNGLPRASQQKREEGTWVRGCPKTDKPQEGGGQEDRNRGWGDPKIAPGPAGLSALCPAALDLPGAAHSRTLPGTQACKGPQLTVTCPTSKF